MRPYEMMVILQPAMEDHSAEVKEIEGLITRLGGELTKTEPWGKRKLAYEIDKLTEGYYAVFTFNFAPEQMTELNRLMKLRANVVRQLTVALDEE